MHAGTGSQGGNRESLRCRRETDYHPHVLVKYKRLVQLADSRPALFAGVTPKIARALVSGALQFSVLEGVKDGVDALLGVQRS